MENGYQINSLLVGFELASYMFVGIIHSKIQNLHLQLTYLGVCRGKHCENNLRV